MKNIERRTFLSKVSLGAIGAIFLSFSPFKKMSKRKHKIPSDIKVKIHPNSVKRN